MWPRHLDVEPEECSGILRRLELEAFSGVVTALRAQGDLNKERRKVLTDLSSVLNISIERHKTEIRRALNDELLATVAKSVSGPNCENEWAREGRRIIPLLRRATPLTAFTTPADNVKGEVESWNKNLMPPINTRTPRRMQLQPRTAAGQMMPPPPPLSELITENGEVRPPSISMPARPRNSMGGDVVVLPSGMVVRVKQEEPLAAEQQAKGRRKRRGADNAPENSCGSYEVLPPGLFFPQQPPTSSAGSPFFSSMSPHPYFGPNMQPQHQPPGGKRRRGGKQYSPAFNPTMLSQSGHGYARPFLPQVPSPLHELEGKIPNTSFAQPMLIPGSGSKVMFVSTSSANQMHSSASPPPLMSMIPQLPRTPIALSPHKQQHVQQQQQQRPTAGKGRGRGQQQQVKAPPPPPPGGTAATSSPQILSPTSQQQQQPGGLNSSKPMILQPPRVALVATSPRSGTTTQVVTAMARTAAAGGTATIQLKDGTLAQGMRVFPAGARILPKPGTTTTVVSSSGAILTAPPAGTPVYMVTTSGGQNVMRVARAAAAAGGANPNVATMITTSTAATTTTQRVVTVSTAALKAAAAATPTLSLRAATPGTIVRTLQPNRPFGAATGTLMRPIGGSPHRPSVIVVQRTPKNSMGGGQRILQTKDGKPVVIVSKPAMQMAALTSATNAAVKTFTDTKQVPDMYSKGSSPSTNHAKDEVMSSGDGGVSAPNATVNSDAQERNGDSEGVNHFDANEDDSVAKRVDASHLTNDATAREQAVEPMDIEDELTLMKARPNYVLKEQSGKKNGSEEDIKALDKEGGGDARGTESNSVHEEIVEVANAMAALADGAVVIADGSEDKH